ELAGDEVYDLVGDVQPENLRLPLDNRDPRLDIGRGDVRQQPRFKPGFQPVGDDLDVFGRTVGGDDDLLVVLVEVVKCMEELFLGRILAREELDIVDQEVVGAAVL